MSDRLTIPGAEFGGYRDPDGRIRPPHPGEVARLYALLAVEVRPGQIAYYRLELDHAPGACTIDLDWDYGDMPIYADPLTVRNDRPTHIRATLSGTIVSDRPDYRPPTRAQQPLPPELPAAPPTGGPQ